MEGLKSHTGVRRNNMIRSYPQKHDPVMYRCGLNDFADSFDITNLEEYVDLESVIEDLEGITEELEEELALLEEEENI